MSGANELTREVDIDIAGLLGHVWRKKWLIILLTIIAGAIVLFAASSISPRYKSSARILIEKRESVFTRQTNSDLGASTSELDEQAIGSQVQVLSSDDIALKVISNLDLVNAPEFADDAKASGTADLLGALGLGPSSIVAGSPEERLLKTFRERLQVYSPEKSRVLVIEFWAKDPELARKIPNAIADEYMALQRQSKKATNSAATEYLEPEINNLRIQVRQAERKVAEFRSTSDILVGNNNALLATQQLSEVSSELSRVRAERSTAEATVASLRSALERGASLDVIPEVIASPLIQRLRERQVSLQAQISELSTTLLPNHPRLKALQNQVSDFANQIRRAARNIQASLENNVQLARQREADLNREVSRLKAESSRVGEAEVELRALEREAAAKRELLASYLTRFREASSRISSDYQPVDARIISRAPLPTESYFPKVIPFTIAGMVVMAILTIIAILAWALLTGKAFKPVGLIEPDMMPDELIMENANADTVGAVEDEIGSPLEAGAIPVVNAPPLTGPQDSDSHTQSAYSSLLDPEPVRASMPKQVNHTAYAANPAVPAPGQFQMPDLLKAVATFDDACIAVLSPGGNAGTNSTMEISRTLAKTGKSVVVMDLTGIAMTTSAMLGNYNPSGVADIIAGAASVEQCIFQDKASNAHIVPAGNAELRPDANPIQRLQSAVNALRAGYDFVIADCGYADAGALAKLGQQELLVIISAEQANPDQCRQLEASVMAAGYEEVVTVAELSGNAMSRNAMAA